MSYNNQNNVLQLAKMFIVILIVFGGCWLPYHTYFIYTYYHTVRNKRLYRCTVNHKRYCIYLILHIKGKHEAVIYLYYNVQRDLSDHVVPRDILLMFTELNVSHQGVSSFGVSFI